MWSREGGTCGFSHEMDILVRQFPIMVSAEQWMNGPCENCVLPLHDRTWTIKDSSTRNTGLISVIVLATWHVNRVSWCIPLPSQWRYIDCGSGRVFRSQWSCGIRRGSSAALLLRLRVWIPPGAAMSVGAEIFCFCWTLQSCLFYI